MLFFLAFFFLMIMAEFRFSTTLHTITPLPRVFASKHACILSIYVKYNIVVQVRNLISPEKFININNHHQNYIYCI